MDPIRLAIERPVAVVAAVLMAVMFGVLALTTIPIQLTPDVRKPVIEIRTNWPGAAPAEVEREIVERHAQLGLGELVSLEPSLPHDELYRGANLVVSTAEGEPFGRTIVEGYARGLPTVGFGSGALPEIVEPDETGLLIPDGDVDALAAALIELAGDRERVAAMGRAGRELAESRFSFEPYLDALEAHHDSVA